MLPPLFFSDVLCNIVAFAIIGRATDAIIALRPTILEASVCPFHRDTKAFPIGYAKPLLQAVFSAMNLSFSPV